MTTARPRAPVVSRPLSPDEAGDVLRLARLAAEHDGIDPLSEQTLLDLTEPGPEHWLVRAEPDGAGSTPGSGALLAYAQLGSADGGARSAELVVAPHARRSGAGRALLAAVAEQAAATGHDLHLWAHGEVPGAQALATGAGLVPIRELWRMARALPAPGTVPTVPGLRPFVLGQDEQAWVDLNRRAFAGHPEQGRLTIADLRAREREPWFRPTDLMLLERAGRPLAYVWLKVEPPLGELYALGVDPGAQGQGLGSALTAYAVAHLAAQGLERAVLYTDADNAAAVRAYRAAGFEGDRIDVQFGPRAPRSALEDATMPS